MMGREPADCESGQHRFLSWRWILGTVHQTHFVQRTAQEAHKNGIWGHVVIRPCPPKEGGSPFRKKQLASLYLGLS